jgi:hypothetical protein
VCDRGDDPVEALTAAAKRFDLSGASLTGIGAFSGVTLGFFDRTRRDYARRVIREQVEVVSLVGNVALDAGEPRVHAHVVVALVRRERPRGPPPRGHRGPDPRGHDRRVPGDAPPENRPGHRVGPARHAGS